MNKTLRAVFDGKVLRPEGPVDLEPDASYVIIIDHKIETAVEKPTLWDALDELTGTIKAPSDWSEEHDHYIHGVPKRGK